MSPLETLAGGLLGPIAAVGIGSGVTRLLGPIPGRWRLATSLVTGVAIIDLSVMLILFLGGGIEAVKLAGVGAVGLGCCILLVFWKCLFFALRLRIVHRSDRWFVAVIVAAVAINPVNAIAPSTKIDELYYHMLIPKRVVEDHGVHLYRWPFEAAFFPQTGFQLGLSAAHAAGFPEAGNVISWGLGAALVLHVAGVTKDLTGSATAGWMTGAISAVGLYPAVLHVTSGPHALEDLATATACLLAVLRDRLTGEMKAQTRLFLVCLAAYTAASTKISVLPLAAIITYARRPPDGAPGRVEEGCGDCPGRVECFLRPDSAVDHPAMSIAVWARDGNLVSLALLRAGNDRPIHGCQGPEPHRVGAASHLACSLGLGGSCFGFWSRGLRCLEARTTIQGRFRSCLRAGHHDSVAVAARVSLSGRPSIRSTYCGNVGALAVPVRNAPHGPVVGDFVGGVPSVAGRASLLRKAVYQGCRGDRESRFIPSALRRLYRRLPGP